MMDLLTVQYDSREGHVQCSHMVDAVMLGKTSTLVLLKGCPSSCNYIHYKNLFVFVFYLYRQTLF